MKPPRTLNELRRVVGGTGDWRQGVWNRWLVSYLSPRDEEKTEETLAPEEGAASSEGAQLSPQTALEERAPQLEPTALSEEPAREPQLESAAPTEGLGEESPQARRAALSARQRLDALSDQIFALETSLDSLSQRLQLGALSERRQNQRLFELLQSLVEAEERNAESLQSCVRSLERLERRMSRLDPGGRSESFFPGEPFTAAAHLPGGRGEGFERRSRESLVPSSVEREHPPRAVSLTPESTSTMNGNLSDLSLATLLSMFELEQRTGRLTVEGPVAAVCFDLSGGLVVGARLDGAEHDAVEALRRAIDWHEGKFGFAPVRVSPSDAPPLSVGALLLRASQQNDEALRVG